MAMWQFKKTTKPHKKKATHTRQHQSAVDGQHPMTGRHGHDDHRHGASEWMRRRRRPPPRPRPRPPRPPRREDAALSATAKKEGKEGPGHTQAEKGGPRTTLLSAHHAFMNVAGEWTRVAVGGAGPWGQQLTQLVQALVNLHDQREAKGENESEKTKNEKERAELGWEAGDKW